MYNLQFRNINIQTYVIKYMDLLKIHSNVSNKFYHKLTEFLETQPVRYASSSEDNKLIITLYFPNNNMQFDNVPEDYKELVVKKIIDKGTQKYFFVHLPGSDKPYIIIRFDNEGQLVFFWKKQLKKDFLPHPVMQVITIEQNDNNFTFTLLNPKDAAAYLNQNSNKNIYLRLKL